MISKKLQNLSDKASSLFFRTPNDLGTGKRISTLKLNMKKKRSMHHSELSINFGR